MISGAQLKRIFCHIMRPENRDGEGECYQVNSGVEAIYDDKKKQLVSLKIDNQLVDDKKMYSIAIQGYHLNNCSAYLNITQEELRLSGKSKVITTSAQEVFKEFLRNNQNITRKIEGRIQYI